MTAKEVLHNLSGALLTDERILSVREKELLTRLFQRASLRSASDHGMAETIAHTVGEVVAERAYGILGTSIAQQLTHHAGRSVPEHGTASLWDQSPKPPGPSPSPQPPSPGSPQPPSPKTSPQPPNPLISPQPPSPKMMVEGTPRRAAGGESGATVLELPQVACAQCVVLDEFLAPAELKELLQFTLAREDVFKVSEVVSPGVQGGAIDFEYRRSQVLMELGVYEGLILDRINACLPRILRQLGQEPFRITRTEAQITSSGDGDFFRWHTDDGHDEIASRQLTFVYFFHREPKAFRGGELRIYDSQWREGEYRPMENYRAVVPRQNRMVFFASSLAHEITPVECPSGAFADSRFTVNGWLHR